MADNDGDDSSSSSAKSVDSVLVETEKKLAEARRALQKRPAASSGSSSSSSSDDSDQRHSIAGSGLELGLGPNRGKYENLKKLQLYLGTLCPIRHFLGPKGEKIFDKTDP